MDFDDQMVFTYRIFRQYPDILAHFQCRWPYLCVDEAQDTSKIQHAILRLLAARTRNIFMVRGRGSEHLRLPGSVAPGAAGI